MVCPCGRQVDTKPSLQVIADGLPSIQQTWKWNMAPWKMLFLYEQAAGWYEPCNHDGFREGSSSRPSRPLHPTSPQRGSCYGGAVGGGA